MNKDQFINECNNKNIKIDDIVLKKLDKYTELLIEWNNKFNLTAITEEKEIYLKHFFDSILLTCFEDFNNKKICDFGTGAGFPGMIIAILYNNSKITLIESNSKKVTFLEKIKKELELDNVEIINDRVEIYAKNNRELYDIVTCRAVANLSIILELSVSMLKVNGIFLPMKSDVEEELKNSNNILKNLGYNLIKVYDYQLPVENCKRTVLKYKKIERTDIKYPRNYSIIKKSVIKNNN